MNVTDSNSARISLSGDWSIMGLTDQVRKLSAELRKIAAASYADPEIDLEAVESLDLGGCQLLAIWLRHVREAGCRPKLVNPPARFLEMCELFGLSREFGMGEYREVA